jgi:hypothetical protein
MTHAALPPPWANRLPSAKGTDWPESGNRIFQDTHVEEDRVREKGGTSHANAQMCSASTTVDVVSSPQNYAPQGLITLTFELNDVARHLAITK